MQETAPSPRKENDRLIRIGGLAVILGLAIHVFVNGVLKQFPPESPTATELQAYLSDQVGTWAIVHGMKYLALVGLVIFAAGAYARTSRMHAGVVAGWGIVGLLGTAIHVTNAFVANGIEVAAFYDFTRLSEEANLFWLLFHTVRVLFTAEIVAWGMVIFGFSMAGFQSATLPRWLTGLGFVGAAASMASGIFIYSILTGGWAEILVNIAALAGMLWFACVGVFMLLRGES